MEANSLSDLYVIFAISFSRKTSLFVSKSTLEDTLTLFHQKFKELNFENFDFICCSSDSEFSICTLENDSLIFENDNGRSLNKNANFFKRIKIYKILYRAFHLASILLDKDKIYDKSVIKKWTYITYY